MRFSSPTFASLWGIVAIRRVSSGVLLLLLIVTLTDLNSISFAQVQTPQAETTRSVAKELKLDTGKEIFEAACIGCHGPRGQGQPQAVLGFQPPKTFPDFTNCSGATPESTYDWRATIHEGGPGRGFSEIMPSFGEALTLEQINQVMQYLRQQCAERAWPMGELNLPRALLTEKAFPEDEVVLTTTVNANTSGGVSADVVYEKRFGIRNQIEIDAPLVFLQRDTGSWVGGVGDTAFGLKRVLLSRIDTSSREYSRYTGSILSVQGEVSAPLGNRAEGLGSGVTTFGTFAAFGQLLPHFSFVQMQTGAELPVNAQKVPRSVFWRAALGKTFAGNHSFGRSWTPMTELLADRDLETGARTTWDIVPEMQITLSRRQHVRLNIGVRRPIINSAGRTTQVMFYLLWDFFDGGLREGW